MYNIAFETTDYISVALFEGDKLIGYKKVVSSNNALSSFFQLLIFILKKNNLSIQDISTIILNCGPGRFTPMRLGITVSRALIQFGSFFYITMNSFEILRSKAKKILRGSKKNNP